MTDSNVNGLETPLTTTLSSRYENVDVTTLIPDFKVGKTPRFSRMFKSKNTCNLSKPRRNVKKSKKKKKCRNAVDLISSDNVSKTQPLKFGPIPEPKFIACDDEEQFLQPIEHLPKQNEQEIVGDSINPACWRNGPAKLWYDMLGVPENGIGFDYGFKLRDDKNEIKEENKKEYSYPDDAYLMVNQLHWEDDIIWNGEDIKKEVLKKLKCKTNAAGWVPSSGNRTAQSFSHLGKEMLPLAGGSVALKSNMNSKLVNDNTGDIWYSTFPIENEELVYGTWEDDIIWDAKNMDKIPHPKILTLDPNDENIILNVPDDIDPAKQKLDNAIPVKVKVYHPHVKKSKLLLGKAGVIDVHEEDIAMQPSKSPGRDPFNVSNDCYYQPRSSEIFHPVGCDNINHSIPVVELKAPFIQTYMGPMRLRYFHRPPMKRYSHGVVAQPIFHSVQPLFKNIIKTAKIREEKQKAAGGSDIFFMRTPDDLTGRDGSIILVEYCEEHPPLLNQVGMCSKLKNYYKPKSDKNFRSPVFKFGENVFANNSPFLGALSPGQAIQVIENNLYRAPIYEHKPLETDFLLIRTRHGYYIREIDALFTAGQLCPLVEVPDPNSKRAKDFAKDFLNIFIYRLFLESKHFPKRIKMEDIKKAFPLHLESSIRKCLKACAEFKKDGTDNWWIIKSNFRLPSEEEIRAMVTPEQCCAYFSMMAAEQRLKDAGYYENFMMNSSDDINEEVYLKMDDEIKVAPWNTTKAYIHALKNKCLLQLSGPADPTGCGEGYSYVRLSNRPNSRKEDQEAQTKRMLTGTDADLRRLSLRNAKTLLKKFAVPEEEIKKLSRWEIIDVVRTLSTEKAKTGEKEVTKYSRGNRVSIAESHEKYREECQRIFDLQNQVLSSHELLSTDEEESFDEEDCSDIEQIGKNIEYMLSNEKTTKQIAIEREENERHKLYEMFIGDRNDDLPRKDKNKINDDYSMQFLSSEHPGRILRIYRTFQGADGKKFTRTEIVRKTNVIDAYVKIRTTREEDFIRKYTNGTQVSLTDEVQKKEIKYKRRSKCGEQFIEQNKEVDCFSNISTSHSNLDFSMINHSDSVSNNVLMPTSGSVKSHTEAAVTKFHKLKTSKLKPDPKVRCGGCGNIGHKRTNKVCPQYSLNPNAPVNVALTEEQEEEIKKQINAVDDENLVNVEGTKVTFSSKLLKHVDEIKKRSLVLKVPKNMLSRKKRKKEFSCDYLKKSDQYINRRPVDPLTALSTIFESVLIKLSHIPDVHPFISPVNAKNVPDYYNIVQNPMDLQTIKKQLYLKKYKNREEFLSDINRIVENSTLYNGAKSSLTIAARHMLGVCVDSLHEKEEQIILLEKAINPISDDNDQVTLTCLLTNVIVKLKTMKEAWPFNKSAKLKQVKGVITQKIDLETIASCVSRHKYKNCKEFLADLNLILENSIVCNGKDSKLTQQARKLISCAIELLAEFDKYLTPVEHNINLVQTQTIEHVKTNSAGDDECVDMQDVEDAGCMLKNINKVNFFY